MMACALNMTYAVKMFFALYCLDWFSFHCGVIQYFFFIFNIPLDQCNLVYRAGA